MLLSYLGLSALSTLLVVFVAIIILVAIIQLPILDFVVSVSLREPVGIL